MPRLIIVSNRLPIVLYEEDGGCRVERGTGGLVTALAPVLRNRGGVWVGWPGTIRSAIDEVLAALDVANRDAGFTLQPVLLTPRELEAYYHGFSNEILWPLFHDLQSQCNFDPSYWDVYNSVNERFARESAAHAGEEDFLWVHDYQLMTMGGFLRRDGITSKLGFFLHIPFPPLDIFLKLPWRFEILRAMLAYDLIGFQTMRDQRNFIHCLKRLLTDITTRSTRGAHVVRTGTREVRVGTFPISIDYGEFATSAASEWVAENAWYMREKFPDKRIILSVDRLDYTKGITYRLKAVRQLLERHPELQIHIVMMQVVIPSRVDIPKYHLLKTEIDRLVGEINSHFTQAEYIPIHYMFRSIPRDELVALYRTADVALVTPIKDGMNLVAKEYCAANVDEQGVLVLSEFAGAAAELHAAALLVNPYDVVGVADELYRALTMPAEERRIRMRKLRRIIKRNDVYRWVDSFLQAAFAIGLEDFPLATEYLPGEE